MKQQAFLLIISTVLLASCQREQDWDGAPDIKAKVESGQKTRTSLSVDESGAGTIYWNPSDQIDVFFGTKKVQYTSQNSSDATTATFKTSASVSGQDVSSTSIWGLFPSSSSSSCNGSSITTSLPSAQYGVSNTFDKDIFPAFAHSSSTNLQFYNVCGGIKFNLAYDDIKKITFRGNNNEDLAGTVSISFVDNLPKATIVNGVKEITLTPKTGTTFTKGADYYFVLLPGTLSAGFTITFTATDGTTGTLNYTDNPVTIKRSIFGKKGNMDVYAAFADGRQPNNVIYYTSSNGQVVTPYKTDVFGANIVSNEYTGGRGIITFDGEVMSIGPEAFKGTRMTSVSIPNSVVEISLFAFENCGYLSSINIPDSVTIIRSYAFQNCSSLASIEIPSSVTEIGNNPFVGCNSLATIVVDPLNPTYDSRNDCNAIIKTDDSRLVSGCKNTIIPDSVVEILSAFQGCTDLTSIEIPASVTLIGFNAFSGCSSLTSIEIPSSVTTIEVQSFYSCRGLTQVVIPSSVTFVGYGAFSSCSGLTSIIVNAASPAIIGDGAFNYTNNCPIYVPAESVSAYKSAEGWSAYADRIYAMGEFYETVDLGLSVKWATCNVGTTSPEEYGDYFAWGETEPKSNYDWSTYKWCNGSNNTLTKYCNYSSYGYNGFTDNKTVLDLEDDAARANWGGSWRIPTKAEWTELRNNCIWTWTTQNGVNGYRVTSNKAGYTDKSIFIPAAAGRSNDTVQGVLGSVGYYWTSSLNAGGSFYASAVTFNSGGGINGHIDSRSVGLPVRPVFGEFTSVQSVSLDQTSLTLTEGASSTLTATVLPSNATVKTVTWSSSNEAVVTVNSAGQVEALSEGTATITAWASDGEHSATCMVTVQASSSHQASSLLVTGQSVTIQLTTQRLTYTIPIWETMEIRDDGGYPILTNGNWLIGDGNNGIPDGVSAQDYYEIITSITYDSGGLPDTIRPLFSVDWENSRFVFDYTKTDPIVDTYIVPIMWSISSSIGDYSCFSEIIIRGEE